LFDSKVGVYRQQQRANHVVYRLIFCLFVRFVVLIHLL